MAKLGNGNIVSEPIEDFLKDLHEALDRICEKHKVASICAVWIGDTDGALAGKGGSCFPPPLKKLTDEEYQKAYDRMCMTLARTAGAYVIGDRSSAIVKEEEND